MPEGDPADLPRLLPHPADGWRIRPDAVYGMARPFTVPADGVLEYQRFIIDPQIRNERLIKAVQIRPGNHAVVHHAGIALRPRGQEGNWRVGGLNDMLLAMYLPGQPYFRCPEGAAKRLPADCEFVLELHYVTVGSAQNDQTTIGIEWADPASVTRELATWAIGELDYEIPPFAANHPVSIAWTVDRDVRLHAIYPHMHLRGKSARIFANYPGGRTDTLVNVPRYDFAWQHRYDFAVPKQIPRGTKFRMSAVYDNSAANPNNPDPSAVVRNGWRTSDEMCQIYMDVSIPYEPTDSKRNGIPAPLLVAFASVLVVFSGFSVARRRSFL